MNAALAGIRSYWESSRAPRYSLLFVLPLVIAYEVLAAAMSYEKGGVRNGADVFLRWVFYAALGPRGPLILGALLMLICGYLLLRDLKASGGELRFGFLLLMAIESAVLASIFGYAVASVTGHVMSPFMSIASGAQAPVLSSGETLMLSLGAGVYEELLFRVILVSLLALIFGKLFGWGKPAASVAAVLIGATIFSAFHYVGPFGDVFQMQSFLFRMIAGVFFSGLYLWRGFGITAWTHALYDVFLML